MKELYNLDQLVKARVRDKFQEKDLLWGSPKTKRFLFWKYSVGGYFYYRHQFVDSHEYTIEELTTGYYNVEEGRKQKVVDHVYQGIKFIVENDKVYFRPSVELRFTNNYVYEKIFDTYEEALYWFERTIQPKIKNTLVVEYS